MLLPPFSGQQLLCKGINETGGARKREGERGRYRIRGGGRQAEMGGRDLGLRSVFGACSPRQPSDSEGVCLRGLDMSWENQ